MWVLRSANSSETMFSTTYFSVTRKKAWDAFRLVSTNFLSHVSVSQTWLRYVLKDIHASFPLAFLPRQLWHG